MGKVSIYIDTADKGKRPADIVCVWKDREPKITAVNLGMIKMMVMRLATVFQAPVISVMQQQQQWVLKMMHTITVIMLRYHICYNHHRY